VKKILPPAMFALMLLFNLFSTPRTNATTLCGQAPPQGRVAVRVGFLTPGETTGLSSLRRNIQSHINKEVEICYFNIGPLPPIPVIQVGSDHSREEAIALIRLIRGKVPGARAFMSPGTASSDWNDRRIPRD
jgi:hypothetical protein